MAELTSKGQRYLKLTDLNSYKIAFNLSNYIWEIVVKWNWFSMRTVGTQFVSAMDSVSANIAEGFGCYFKRDKIRFYKIALASVLEAVDWNEKAFKRGLLRKEEYNHILSELNKLPQEINSPIAYTESRLKR